MMRTIMIMMFLVCCLVFWRSDQVVASSTATAATSSPTAPTNLHMYWQSEMAATSAAQNKIISFLKQRNVPIGEPLEYVEILRRKKREAYFEEKSSEGLSGEKISSALLNKVVVSSSDNNIECRIALGRAPLGSKCVAPCGCTGSQKWIQFSQFNRLRRMDPSQWQLCQTCRQPFEVSLFSEQAGLSSQILGLLLNRRGITRGVFIFAFAVLAYVGNLSIWLSRLLVSGPVWNAHVHWSKITHLPMPLKLWLGKAVLQWLSEQYIHLERKVLWNQLIDLETSWLEDALPVRDADASSSTSVADKEGDDE